MLYVILACNGEPETVADGRATPETGDSTAPGDRTDTGQHEIPPPDPDDTGGADAGEEEVTWKAGSLAEAAWASGRRVGAAISVSAFEADHAYRDLFLSQFSAWTPENATKWAAVQASGPDRWDFSAADAIAAEAAAAGLAMKGHALIWHDSVPGWVGDGPEPGILKEWVEANIAAVAGHYAGTAAEWDVVNEALADSGGQGLYGLRESLFYRGLGEDYIAEAFHAAHAADPDARLLYNDYNLIGNGQKTERAVELVASLVARGVPIDGVGLQCHITASRAPSRDTMAAALAGFADLGLAVHVSELDVQIRDLDGPESERLFAQALVVHRLANACAAQPACDLITLWGFTDRYSWIDSWYGPDDPLIYDEDLAPKPARDALIAGLTGQPLDGCSDERVENGTFEDGMDGWSVWAGSIALDTDAAHGGKQGVRVSGRTGTWVGPVRDVSAELGEAVPYTASAWVRIAGASSDEAFLTAAITEDGTTRYQRIAAGTASDSTWTQLSGDLTLSLSGSATGVELYVEGPASGVDLLVDDVSVVPRCNAPLPVVPAN